MTNELNETVEKQPKKRRIQEPATEGQKRRWVRIRLLPIWLRIILVLLLFIIVIAIGLVFGYSFIGEGQSGDALKWSTWKHILDIMNGVEE